MDENKMRVVNKSEYVVSLCTVLYRETLREYGLARYGKKRLGQYTKVHTDRRYRGLNIEGAEDMVD